MELCRHFQSCFPLDDHRGGPAGSGPGLQRAPQPEPPCAHVPGCGARCVADAKPSSSRAMTMTGLRGTGEHLLDMHTRRWEHSVAGCKSAFTVVVTRTRCALGLRRRAGAGVPGADWDAFVKNAELG